MCTPSKLARVVCGVYGAHGRSAQSGMCRTHRQHGVSGMRGVYVWHVHVIIEYTGLVNVWFVWERAMRLVADKWGQH